MKKITFPCLNAKLVPASMVVANDYNPNKVAPPEMKLLQTSIEEDGVTMAIVTYYDETSEKYIVVDGFHRYTVLTKTLHLPEIPVVVIEKEIGDRMASTIRHNRARGSHDIDLMSNIVAELVEMGKSDQWIARKIGMDAEEILRLKQITGIAALFRDNEFSRAWVKPGQEMDLYE
ncbi:MAG: ParB/RepB/Spo0J family partition protein [Desulfobulbus sp.]|jgi:ParB-like chromosome segregation protein Spo0J|uniref:IbrB-like domain-containing protein n=1 Tax=Desulfobulbus sp. TaxID=895 RepID=UPI00285146F2|nr:ParB/RepB/Spo0J family partition protein [Desulfobulbus sp.]MDR2551429.1 ParB/RepB/Spo0J family partition protein [Desulfobulbus sp.]